MIRPLVDADPQGSAAAWGARREVLIGPDVVHVPLASVPDTVEAARERYDLVLLDTPGQATASNKALACADLVLVPCRPTIPDIEVAARAHATASRVAAAAAFVVVQVPGRGEKRAQATDDALSELGPVAPVRVGFRNAFADAMALGLGVTEFQPRSKAAAGHLDYRKTQGGAVNPSNPNNPLAAALARKGVSQQSAPEASASAREKTGAGVSPGSGA